jgi:hypothetical protein
MLINNNLNSYNMSQENSYYQISSVQTVRTPTYAESVASVLNDLMNAAPVQITANV